MDRMQRYPHLADFKLRPISSLKHTQIPCQELEIGHSRVIGSLGH